MVEDPDDEQVKDTFAHFGLATYMANVVETGLAHCLLQIEFLTNVKAEFVRTRGADFDREKFGADFDAYLDQQFEYTMGNLVKRLNKLVDLGEDLRNRITSAKARRDFLAHHYWRVMAVTFSSPEGRAKMIEELKNDADTFEQLDRDLHAALKPMRESIGLDDDLLDARTEAALAKIRTA